MKQLFLLASIALFSFGIQSCTSNSKGSKTEKKEIKKTEITFIETNHDFGTITQGEKVSHVFKFKNSGTNPLEITQAQPSCGCTIPQWTEDPIEPGKEGFIQVMFNSEGREGKQHKTVTVVSNTTPATHQLTFTAEVVKKNKK